MNIYSPVTGSNAVELCQTIPCAWLIEHYRDAFQIGTSQYFNSLSELSIYQCKNSGYRFYYPFDVAGDDEFYRKLSVQPWYYMDWKWEYEVATNFIEPGHKVLDIGCGKAAFVEALKDRGVKAVGLELNQEQVMAASQKGLTVLPEMLEAHALKCEGEYDVVCAFQVLEHIVDVAGYFKDCLKLLKPGAKLIVSVPNNDAFVLKCDSSGILNMPPHHMGLWDANSLAGLGRFFPMRIDGLEIEPLQEYHEEWASNMAVELLKSQHTDHLASFINTNQEALSQLSLSILKYLPGHTILAHYSKSRN